MTKRNEDAANEAGARANLKELAQHLGLSQSTVSRVVNNSAQAYRISASTQERVLAAAAKMNYKANHFARGLRNKRSQTVGVIVPEISDGYSTSVLGGIEDVLLLGGYFYFVVSHRHRAELLREYPSLLLSRAVEGIIAVDSAIDGDLPVPVVAVSGHLHGRSVVNIELDHLLAARFALEHLHRLGHTKIAFIKGQSFSSDTRARWKAISKVADDLGIAINPRLTAQLEGAALGYEPGRVATVRLLETGQPFTAIFAFNDLSAMGAIVALREAGINVPSDVSVVGFDDIPSAATNNPPLTTVRQPLQEMGRVAATMLLERIQSDEPRPQNRPTLILPTFVERQTTARAAGLRKAAPEPLLLRTTR